MQAKVYDVLKLQILQRDPETNWKKVGLELKLAELIENLEQTRFDEPATAEHLRNVTENLMEFVENLSIKKLKARVGYNKNPVNEKARVVNFSSDECYHGSRQFLGGLKNLKKWSVRFDPGLKSWNYEKRFFQVAAIDIENIGKALKSLKQLESFAIQQSDLSDSIKVYHLLTPMKAMEHLKVIELSYCGIKSTESGQHFEEFLSVNRSLKHLELKGNELGLHFCFHLAKGIQKFAGKLSHLGLSLTRILGNGLNLILNSLDDKKYIESLDISKCVIGKSDNWVKSLIRLIERQGSLRMININENEIDSKLNKEKFIKAIDKNYEIVEINCENCGKKIFY